MSRKSMSRVLAAVSVALLLSGAAPAWAGMGTGIWGGEAREATSEALWERIWNRLVTIWEETGILIDPNGTDNPGGAAHDVRPGGAVDAAYAPPPVEAQ